jgi:hypothetical protein
VLVVKSRSDQQRQKLASFAKSLVKQSIPHIHRTELLTVSPQKGEKRIMLAEPQRCFCIFLLHECFFSQLFYFFLIFRFERWSVRFYIFLGLNKPGLNFTLGKLHSSVFLCLEIVTLISFSFLSERISLSLSLSLSLSCV